MITCHPQDEFQLHSQASLNPVRIYRLMCAGSLQEQESGRASEQHCAQLEKSRRELERQLSGLSERLEEEEACSAQLALHRDRLEAECSSLRRDLDELEGALTEAEHSKQVLIQLHRRCSFMSEFVLIFFINIIENTLLI